MQHCINFHCYTDGSSLSVKPDETNQAVKLQACLQDMDDLSFLLLSPDKNESKPSVFSPNTPTPHPLPPTPSYHTTVTLKAITFASSSAVVIYSTTETS